MPDSCIRHYLVGYTLGRLGKLTCHGQNGGSSFDAGLNLGEADGTKRGAQADDCARSDAARR